MLFAPLQMECDIQKRMSFSFSWKDDTLEVMREIDELENVFSKLYRFDIHRHEIDAQNPVRDTHAKVTQFLLEKGSKDHLLILYFPRHAIPSHQGNEAPIWPA
jgi:hypothetical protein